MEIFNKTSRLWNSLENKKEKKGGKGSQHNESHADEIQCHKE